MNVLKDLNVDIFKLFDEQWALVSAGTPDDYNTMTISWGSLGTLWAPANNGKPIATIYVKPIRHTFKYLEANEYFTLSFFPTEYKKDLAILGSKSGRDGDKVALTQLTPKAVEHGVTFSEASLTLVCRKIYSDDFKREKIPADVAEMFYKTEEPHRFYIGEVIAKL